MPKIDVQGTKFELSALPSKLFSKGYWARTRIAIENEYVKYRDTGESLTREELENLIFSAARLLAGAYGKEYNLSFEKAGLAVDLYPYTDNGNEATREERRKNDCVMAIRLLMRSPKKGFLGGVYSVLLHREEIQTFIQALREEYDAAFARFGKGRGKYLFAGVSPSGYRDCNYWYLDPSGTVEAGEYVWVRMGKRDIEQIVYVDRVRYCSDETAPYDPTSVKQVLRKATEEELRDF